MKRLLFSVLMILLMTAGCVVRLAQVPAQPPTAYIDSISPSNAPTGQSVTFTGHGTDPDGTVVGYKWRSSINGDVGTMASFQTSALSPGVHSITLSVQDNNGNWSPEVSSSLTITGGTAAVPVVNTFNASPGNISSGGSSTLSWDVSGASTVTIDQGIGTVSLSGTRVVSPGTSTIYTLTATNASGSAPATAQVIVEETIPIPIPTPSEEAKPDLVVLDITRSGSTISYNIQNQGTATASATTSVLTIDGVTKAYDPVGPLDAGVTSTESFTYSYTCSGTSDAVAVQADKDNAVIESNEGNNAHSETWNCLLFLPPLLLAKPDLIITDVKHESAKVKYTIKNQGTVNAGSSTTAVYINGSLWSTDPTGTIAAGATSTQSFSPTLFLIVGDTYDIKVVADKGDVVEEGNEGNNAYTETWGP